MKGYFKSENSGGIPIGAFNVPRGSVKVSAGGRQLLEGVDFVVDYLAGKVQIIDPGLQASGVPISVSTENNAVFNQQRKTFMGVDVEHRFSDKFTLGGTVLNVEERPLTPKVNFGSEPINNTMLGLNVDYAAAVPFFTKLANKLPFVDTDVPSNVSVRADMAYLLPGTPSGIDVAGAATSYKTILKLLKYQFHYYLPCNGIWRVPQITMPTMFLMEVLTALNIILKEQN